MEKKEEKTKVIGGGENEKVKPKPEIVKKIVDDWEDEDEEEHEKRIAVGLRILLPNDNHCRVSNNYSRGKQQVCVQDKLLQKP